MSKRVWWLLVPLFCCGCRRDMFDEPKYRPLQPSQFFVDGRSARPVPAGTYEYGGADSGEAVEQGTLNGNFVARIPVAVDEPLLRRGQERFNIYCSPCHSRTGDGYGMVAKRGFIQPADLRSDRVRNAPPGYIYAVIANGFGAMPEYSKQIDVRDRWAIVAYIRALQLSQRATVADLSPSDRQQLENAR
jgi:mono/diheme cytochrome c family protein